MISTAGDATLTTSEPGHLANGAFTLAQPLRVELRKRRGPAQFQRRRRRAFKQSIDANDPLRTGLYAKTLTFTLSTTTP